MSVSITIDQTQKTLLYSRSSPFNVQCHRPNPSWDCFEWGPGLCWCVQPQTNPSWDCSRHFCDIPTYNVTDPIPAGIAFEGDPAYAGEYSHRPIPAGIARVSLGICQREANHYSTRATTQHAA